MAPRLTNMKANYTGGKFGQVTWGDHLGIYEISKKSNLHKSNKEHLAWQILNFLPNEFMHAYFQAKTQQLGTRTSRVINKGWLFEVLLNNRLGSGRPWCPRRLKLKTEVVTSRESATCPVWPWIITVAHQSGYMSLLEPRNQNLYLSWKPFLKMGQIKGIRLDGDVKMKAVQ